MCNASRKSAYRGDFDLCFFFYENDEVSGKYNGIWNKVS